MECRVHGQWCWACNGNYGYNKTLGDLRQFLDVGGGANASTVEAGFRIILKDPSVKAILINIFGVLSDATG